MLGNLLSAIGAAHLAATEVLPPILILILCVVAGVGTVMLLPSRREAPLRTIGGIVLLAAGLILVAMLVRYAAGETGGMGAYFWIFSAIAIIGALRVITHPRPVYSALYFVLTVMASAGLFVLLWAEFMAAALVLIYAGAILVTYVFVIMLATEASTPEAPTNVLAEYDTVSREPLAACAVGFTLMGVLLFLIFDRSAEVTPPILVATTTAPAAEAASAALGPTQQLGQFLFTDHLISLELAGLILTVAMIGAIVIARRRIVPHVALEAEPGVVTAPATPIDDNPHSIPVYGTDNPRQKEYPEA